MEVVRDPRQFDVIVTCNLSATSSALGAQLAGGLVSRLRQYPSGRTSLFEPVHVPHQHRGKGIANRSVRS